MRTLRYKAWNETREKKAGRMTISKPFLKVLAGQRMEIPPVWLMRQAGRYLPEYRAVRAQAGGFLDLVFNPALACEVTLQPLRRFGFDAAILFSDILIVPQAMHCSVRFDAGEGPRLAAVDDDFVSALDPAKFDVSVLTPVFETVSLIAQGMKTEGFDRTALIGFAGSPWTVACYMIEGRGGTDFAKSLHWVREKPEVLQVLMDHLADVSADYLIAQVAAGAEALQLFDSWAGLLADEDDFRRWVIEPTRRVIARVRRVYPDIPVIGFPRAAGRHYKIYAGLDIQALGLDQDVSLADARLYQTILPVQGNLDPALLMHGEGLEEAIDEIVAALAGGPHIFNLGHGISKETPPEHVARLVSHLRRINV